MSTVRNLAVETIVYGLSSILPRVLHYVVFTIYLSWKFTQEMDYGIYRDLYAYVSIFLVFMIFRMDTAFFRFATRDYDKNTAFSSAVFPVAVISFLVVIAMLIFDDTIAMYLKYPDQAYYVRWFAFILGFDAICALPYAKMRLDNRPIKFLGFKLLNSIITIVLVLFFLEIVPRYFENTSESQLAFFQGFSKLDYVFFANLVASAFIFLLLLPDIIKTKLKVDKPLIRKMLAYSLPLVVVALAGGINTTFTAALQKFFLTGEITERLQTVGMYAVPASLAILLNLFNTAFLYAAEPFFFKQHKQSKSTKLFGEIALVYVIFALLMVLLISFNVDRILLLMGKNYRSITDIVPILLFAYVFLGLYYNFSIWYKLADKTKIGAVISLVGAVITIGISLACLPVYGYIASAWAAFICFGSMAILAFLTGQKYYPIEYPVFKIVRQILMAYGLLIISNFMYTQFDLSSISHDVLNTILILIYLAISYTLEKPIIKELISLR